MWMAACGWWYVDRGMWAAACRFCADSKDRTVLRMGRRRSVCARRGANRFLWILCGLECDCRACHPGVWTRRQARYGTFDSLGASRAHRDDEADFDPSTSTWGQTITLAMPPLRWLYGGLRLCVKGNEPPCSLLVCSVHSRVLLVLQTQR